MWQLWPLAGGTELRCFLGLMAGVAALIPYAGAVIGIGSAMIVGYFSSDSSASAGLGGVSLRRRSAD